MTSLLTVSRLAVSYGAVRAVRDVSLEVEQGALVTILGANGAGKTSILKAIMGLQRPASGEVVFDGQVVSGRKPYEIFDLGIATVPENRQVWATMTVEENLRMGWFKGIGDRQLKVRLAESYDRFPLLSERRRQLAGQLSGGEQQILAFARARMSHPRLILMDEPSLGLAPKTIQSVFEMVADACSEGLTILMAEQNALMALRISSGVYVLEHGEVVTSGAPETIAQDESLQRAYLGG